MKLRVCGLFGALLLWAGVAAAQDDATRSAARRLATAGVEAYQRDDVSVAVDKLQRAYEMLPVPSIGLWLARSVGYPNDSSRNDAWEAAPSGGFDKFAEHVFAFVWQPAKIEWYADDVLVHSFSGETQNLIGRSSTKIMLNLWVFGSSAAFGDPTKNVYPMVAKIDWFRFYRLDSDTTYPCAPTPACLSAADKTSYAQNNPKELNYGQ